MKKNEQNSFQFTYIKIRRLKNIEINKNMFNAIQFFKDFNIEYTETGKHTSRGWININCPLPEHTDNTFHGGIHLKDSRYHCWECGGHQLKYIIKILLNISYKETEEIIYNYSTDHFIIPDLRSTSFKEKISRVDMPGGFLKKIHKKYLKKRGFNYRYLIKKYGILGTTHIPATYKYRIIIPIYYNKKLISFQGRDVTDKQDLRYKGLSPNKSILNYKHTLYGLDHTNHKQIGVVEGVTDQWKMGDGFVSSFGTALSNQQLKILSTFDRVFFLYDPEKQAQEKALSYAKHLSALSTKVEIIDLELNTDPGDLLEDDVKYIRRELKFV